ncbi:MAG: SSU ribosomal protein S11P [Candidatus Uhrbacteria bacterium GW2011_GWF2_41_16]|jgi:small subunit ribosomal protein S11|uniref:Small ribosomal subunit protein uS11 n=2 Tax=Candidatus Uhriibacteriota TaxID=1752732 RepID=A0A0G0VC64_9BACT|nr:MAG: SSU ribosomal protein S11P [Candidatus Uhrbacteria bacterium GW2011_GWA2_41_10]KKR86084.1 MAG: SSU ribosomal protein S11P [Candidatus Uhrbacteria bacterium GW2011_GWC2_41_11]KKR97216.1 MAG: SSU ribosomal protein S11P [Candidatus Uhrbacteria bacterium GW2011_GWF2_41_16]HBP00427.1 30S ribosomal protein S11 [Candidatus Uhrbacteria bacterium]
MTDETKQNAPKESNESSGSSKKTTKPRTNRKAVKKTIHQVPHGRVYVQATFNNTIITLTDLNGNTLAWASAGMCGFRGPKKATPYAAGMIVRNIAEKVQLFGVHDLNVFVHGVGSGRDAAVRAFHANGFNVLSIKDTTPLPHNGCRAPRPRRV